MPVAVPNPIINQVEADSCPMESASSKQEQAIKFRALESEDYDRGYLECLSHLTVVGDISREQFNGTTDLCGVMVFDNL